MEVVGRDPAKQALIEATLQSVKGSKSYPDIESKIRSVYTEQIGSPDIAIVIFLKKQRYGLQRN